MKLTRFLLAALVISSAVFFTMANIKSDEIFVEASYQKLACEGCFHMTVVKSQAGNFLGKTIIPVSNLIDIEKMVDSVALSNERLCLKGRPYRFSFNLFAIDPDGVKFEVLSVEDSEVCSTL